MAVLIILKTGDQLFLAGGKLPDPKEIRRSDFYRADSYNGGDTLIRCSEISTVTVVPDEIVERLKTGRKVIAN